MPEPLKVAVAGIGRMGTVHALHVCKLGSETGACVLAALVDADVERARRFGAENGRDNVPTFASVGELAEANICTATVIATPTEQHRKHAASLIAAGHRVLLEKPLTGTLEEDREFSAELDRKHPNGLMLAFQRRFDEPLRYAKHLMDTGSIGKVFKIYSALEDSDPPPNGYQSSGILPDMSVHNVDEILWFTGRMPRAGISIGSRVYSHRLTTGHEDFDDALLHLWFDDMVAQVQVSRNHVSGYRVETILFGDEGLIHIGRFEQNLRATVVEAYGRPGRSEPIAHRTFTMPDYGQVLPEFMNRFGPAYKAEVAAFVECCRTGTPFPTSHRDGLRAMEVISAGMRTVLTPEQASAVERV